MKNRGRLYVFEGLDGSGKTTIARNFCELLNQKNHSTKYFSFPGHLKGTLGGHIHGLHHDLKSAGLKQINAASLQLLHVAAHIDNIESAILPLINGGEWVILDRYWWSTWVYGLTAGVDRRALRMMVKLESVYWKDLRPTAVFWIKREILNQNNVGMDYAALVNAYSNLAEMERRKYPVHVINNDACLDSALEEIVKRAKLPKT
jgi:thymidylate kinase